MDWRALLEPEIQTFMKVHKDEDVRILALKKPPDVSWPYPLILNQIKVRQKSRQKTPKISETGRFVFPNNSVFEHKFDGGVAVECDSVCAEILAHNANVLGLSLEVVHGGAEEYVATMERCDLVYIDPQRRDDTRKGKYDLSACSPNVIDMLPALKNKAHRVMIKTSPFLDIDKTVLDLGCVTDVHVVQYQGDCKEVLYVLDPVAKTSLDYVQIHAVTLDDNGSAICDFSFSRAEERAATSEYAMPEKYIYEPGPAGQKAGGFKTIGARYGLKKLHPHTHLYASTDRVDGFPGKVYEIIDIMPVKANKNMVSQADLALRNFPATVDGLRKKLKLAEGGTHRIYATTLKNNEKKLIICLKEYGYV